MTGVVSWDAMTYRGLMHTTRVNRSSAAYRFGYALGSTAVRLIAWPLALFRAGDSE